MKFMEIKPQKARGKLLPAMWNDPSWVAEVKYDGHRAIAQFCDGTVRFTSGRESVKGGLTENTLKIPHLSGVMFSNDGGRLVPLHGLDGVHLTPLLVRKVLEGTVLDGELVAVGRGSDHEGRSKYVGAILNTKDPAEALEKQIQNGFLQYVVFDCLWYKGQDLRNLPYIERRSYVVKVIKEWGNPYAAESKVAAVQKHAFYAQVIADGGEGVVLKHIDHRYGDQSLWVKVKYRATADCVIMGFEAAKELSKKKGADVKTLTKYAAKGLIGAVSLGQYPAEARVGTQVMFVQVATVSGFPDTLREDMTKHPEQYVGRVVRIKHNGREPSGRFRHPRWDCLRDDKKPRDCIFDLEEA